MSQVNSHRVDHVAIVVRDAEAAAAWYGQRFGMQVVHDEIDPFGVRMIFLAPTADTKGTSIQVLSPGAEGSIAQYLSEHGEGLHHICLAVNDIKAAILAAGDDQTAPFIGGKGRLCAFPLQVPNNVRLELVEENHPQPATVRTDHAC
jgi:methylmalonyl-CoA/ethylmalonyl-CoA epimerase